MPGQEVGLAVHPAKGVRAGEVEPRQTAVEGGAQALRDKLMGIGEAMAGAARLQDAHGDGRGVVPEPVRDRPVVARLHLHNIAAG